MPEKRYCIRAREDTCNIGLMSHGSKEDLKEKSTRRLSAKRGSARTGLAPITGSILLFAIAILVLSGCGSGSSEDSFSANLQVLYASNEKGAETVTSKIVCGNGDEVPSSGACDKLERYLDFLGLGFGEKADGACNRNNVSYGSIGIVGKINGVKVEIVETGGGTGGLENGCSADISRFWLDVSEAPR